MPAASAPASPAAPARAAWLWLPLVWLLCLALAAAHVVVVRDYLGFLNGVASLPGDTATARLPHLLPGTSADTMMWVHHARAVGENGTWRVRHTAIDNAPFGREVHWSTPFTWIVAAGGAARAALTGESPALALERSLAWTNLILFAACLVPLSLWVARRLGPGVGALVALVCLGHGNVYLNFTPFNVDHHGLVTVALAVLLLGLALAGLGWTRPGDPLLPADLRAARRAAVVSAVAGAVGLWLNAASILPGIAAAGALGLVAVWRLTPALAAAGAAFDPGVWRLWGRTGGALGIVFYLLEYAPAHLGFRLEVNHPLWAAGWWGGAEVVATLAAWRVASLAAPAARPAFPWPRLLLPALAIIAPPAAIVAGGTAVFAVSDPFSSELRHFVAEGQTFLSAVRHFGFGALALHLASCVLVVLGAVVAVRARAVSTRLAAGFLAAASAAFAALGFAVLRWWSSAASAQLALVAVLFALALARRRRVAIAVCVLVAAGTVQQTVGRIVQTRSAHTASVVSPREYSQVLFRYVASTLRAEEPVGDFVVLADPDASLALGYYGGMHTLGTLYWENIAGLRAAAEILCARDEAEAAALVRARGVTHIVSLLGGAFLPEYHHLLRPGTPPEAVKSTFGYKLAHDPENAPRWLRPVPFRRLAELGDIAERVALFRVDFNQTEPRRLHALARVQIARDRLADADATLVRLLDLVPPAEQPGLCLDAAARFYDFGADARAAAWFRRALALAPDPAAANTLAWILATTADRALRDGRAALALVEPLVEAGAADAAVLSTYAAACAEISRWPAAVAAAERALAAARAQRDTAAEPLLLRRLESYRAGRPWRQ